MEFGDIEVLSNTSYDEVFPIFMKSIQCVFQISKSLRIVGRILSKIDEIQDGSDSFDSLCRHGSNEAAKENLCHVLPFSTRYLRQGENTIFELPKTISRRKCSNAPVQLLRTEDSLAPMDQMLENSLVQLM